MKKCFFFFAAIAFTLFADAQKGSFGLKAGLNIYKISQLDVIEGSTTKVGWHGGAFYRVPLRSLVYLQPELLYSAEGAKFEEADFSAKINLNYINVPLMLQLSTPEGFYLETGPQVGFLLNAKTKYSEGGQDSEEDISEDTKKVMFSWGGGAGYWSGNVGFGARYNFGLSRMQKDAGDGNNKSNGFQVSLLLKLHK